MEGGPGRPRQSAPAEGELPVAPAEDWPGEHGSWSVWHQVWTEPTLWSGEPTRSMQQVASTRGGDGASQRLGSGGTQMSVG